MLRPVALRHRRILFHLRPAVEVELQKLEDAGVIEKLLRHTPGMPFMVVANKPKQPACVPICTDMCLPNKELRRITTALPQSMS
ncbi:hypothetical protein NDU88_000300 [Pleurodeles waltl]|uniref:Uncharacterized protein n=1 Tax=Pleurodeles waltl TaxID=8319 RepID=A0AAV7R4H0_PLEWA|nr:hypothetical protein NDU88_000300 [Pleurodeles waltl]